MPADQLSGDRSRIAQTVLMSRDRCHHGPTHRLTTFMFRHRRPAGHFRIGRVRTSFPEGIPSLRVQLRHRLPDSDDVVDGEAEILDQPGILASVQLAGEILPLTRERRAPDRHPAHRTAEAERSEFVVPLRTHREVEERVDQQRVVDLVENGLDGFGRGTIGCHGNGLRCQQARHEFQPRLQALMGRFVVLAPGHEQVEVLDYGQNEEGVAGRQEVAQPRDRRSQFDAQVLVSGRRQPRKLLVLITR